MIKDMTSGVRKQKIYYDPKRKNSIHIVFVMFETKVCNKSKEVIQHASILNDRGFKVSIVAHDLRPTWFPDNLEYVQVPMSMELAKFIPDCDIIVATYYDQIRDCINTGIAPVVYFEQGGDHIDKYNEYLDEDKEMIKVQFKVVPFIVTDSKHHAKEIHQLFNKKAEVIHNAVEKLVQFYRSVSKYKIQKYNSLNNWIINISDEDFKTNEDLIKFKKVLLWSDVDKVYILRLYRLNDFVMGVWELGAEKKKVINDRSYYCYSLVKGYEYPPNLKSYIDHEIDEAKLLNIFRKYSADITNKLHYFKIIAYSMISLGLYVEAKAFIENGLREWESCTDLYIYYALTLKELGHKEKLQDTIDIINRQKEYAVQDDFIYNVREVADEILREGIDRLDYEHGKETCEADYLYNFANKLYENGLYDEAMIYYLKYMKIEKDMNKIIETYRKIGLCHLHLENYEACRLSCFSAFQLSTPRSEECYLVGLSFYHQDRYDEAAFWYSLASKCRPIDTLSS